MRTLASTSLLLVLTACTQSSAIELGRQEERQGNYYMAYRLVDHERSAQQARGQVDAELETEWTRLRLVYLLEEARARIFLEQEPEALLLLAKAKEQAPEHSLIPVLVERAKTKMAERATRRGLQHVDKREFPEALAAFAEAQEAVPGWPPAAEGTQKVRAAFDAMAGRAQQQFLEAVRKLPQSRFVEVNWHATAAMESDPSREDAKDIRVKAQRELADQAMKRASSAEVRGLYGAALVEYRGAKALDPERQGVEELIAHMEREVRAQQLIEQAAMDLRNDRFEKAKVALDEAFGLSVLERGTISELLLQSRQRQGMIAYEIAKDLELQGKKEAALAALEALAKDWPDGLADEKTRIGALRSDIDAATREWAAAEAAEQAGKDAEAIEHYEAVEIYYPGWKETKVRIAALKAKQRPAAGGNNGGQ